MFYSEGHIVYYPNGTTYLVCDDVAEATYITEQLNQGL